MKRPKRNNKCDHLPVSLIFKLCEGITKEGCCEASCCFAFLVGELPHVRGKVMNYKVTGTHLSSLRSHLTAGPLITQQRGFARSIIDSQL